MRCNVHVPSLRLQPQHQVPCGCDGLLYCVHLHRHAVPTAAMLCATPSVGGPTLMMVWLPAGSRGRRSRSSSAHRMWRLPYRCVHRADQACMFCNCCMPGSVQLGASLSAGLYNRQCHVRAGSCGSHPEEVVERPGAVPQDSRLGGASDLSDAAQRPAEDRNILNIIQISVATQTVVSAQGVLLSAVVSALGQ